MKNFRLLLAYDGSRYRGWQRLTNCDLTIQGKMESVLSKLFEEPVTIVGSGRTDAGVHARGQVANFWMETAISSEEVCAYLRRYLPEDIGVISVEETDLRFHSRLSAKEKTYSYRVWNSTLPNVFERRYLTVFPEPLDIKAMQKGAEALIGEHNFLSFCSNKHFKKSPVRTIKDFRIEQCDQEIRFLVTANGFLYNMMRIMAGTLLEIGMGQREWQTIEPLFISPCREKAGFTAPAKGLCLEEVRY